MEELTKTSKDEIINRFQTIHNQISVESDLANMLAYFISGIHNFNYSMTLSNEINDRQGKNRIMYSSEVRELMKTSNEDNVEFFIDSTLNSLFLSIINSYLSDYQTLPEGVRNKQKALSRVKTLYVRLFATNNYSIIKQSSIPDYLKDKIDAVFEYLYKEKVKIFNEWIEYLDKNESPEIVNIIKSVGQDIFEAGDTKAIQLFNQIIPIAKLKDYNKTYNTYLDCRSKYLMFTRNIGKNILSSLFELTDDQYNKSQRALIEEITDQFNSDEASLAIKRLLYEV